MHNKAITKKRKKICLLLGSKSSEDVNCYRNLCYCSSQVCI